MPARKKPKLRYPLDEMVRHCKNGPHQSRKQYDRKDHRYVKEE